MTDENLTGDEKAKDEREEIYYQGSPSLWGYVGKLLVCGLLALGAAIGCFALTPYGWYIPVLGVLVAAALVVVPVLLIRSTRYRVTSYRIDYERGLLSKTIDTLELWHIDDIKFHQSFLNRLLGIGQITVISSDDTTPQLVLQAIPGPRPVFDAMKQRIITVKRQRGVIKLDAG
jgi:membrane protein YdbS with pleckstrin-like domain